MSSDYGRTKILFVCLGNACRSPMAEAIARLDAYDVIEAFSAGLTPLGYLAGMTKQILLMNGYSVEGLESKGISPEIWDQADIVINMSGLPREGAFREYSKVEDWEIKDPFGGHPGDYQQAFERIRLRVAELAEKCRGEHVSVRSGNRRAQPRLCLASPIFVNLNDANGGVAFDVSIDGFGLSCATALPGGPLHNMRIQFPGTQHWIEVSGHVAWKNDSDRKAGIRFEGLKQEESRQIRSWISEQLAVSNFQDQTVGIGEDRNKLPEFPIAPHSESAIPSPTTSFGVSLEEEKVSLFPPATAPTLPLPGQPASVPTTGTFFKKQLDKRGVPSSAKPARNRRFAATVRPSWTAFAAVGVLVGLFILSMDWVKAWRDDSNETSASLTQQAEASSEAIQNATAPAVGAIAKTPDAREGNLDQRPSGVEPVISGDYDGIPNTSVKDLEPQALRVEHSTSVASSSAADPVVKKNELPAPGTKHLQVDARASVSNPPLNDPAQNVAGVERPASKRVFKITNSSVGSAVARRPAPTDTSRAAEGPISLAAMKLRPLHGRIMPATSRQLEPPMTPAVILASSSATADPKAMETLIAIAKQPAIPLRNTGAIAIFADPYPSLRLPDRGISKKQRQATSLQLGRLLSRVEPVYPEDAKDHGIQGTVKLHAIIGRQGSVKNLESVDGSPVLVAAAINAVRQWRYSETILAGQSVETEEDIAVTFRLSNPPPPAN